jgi:hypothetical protein
MLLRSEKDEPRKSRTTRKTETIEPFAKLQNSSFRRRPESIESTTYRSRKYLLNNPLQEAGLGVCFSGLYKTGMFYQSVHGRIHSGAERLIPTLQRLERCTDFMRSYSRKWIPAKNMPE